MSQCRLRATSSRGRAPHAQETHFRAAVKASLVLWRVSSVTVRSRCAIFSRLSSRSTVLALRSDASASARRLFSAASASAMAAERERAFW